jgi:hypothetical protein
MVRRQWWDESDPANRVSIQYRSGGKRDGSVRPACVLYR